ncbi:putative phosphoenolpyruvate synthase [Actinoplanes missouriensis 431]|uniref:Putative phosphoenolpyruvate synthase n=1 Tax=Actinoplanes missouriensis (strain ATCC 14538 / DSM 43046 / CBS 188.64 / JCM 3121 / NBRC 102363 / NCIMB 12654 / NRRL B-3342 / UNCC 431) TaxID=512565 RepID=I0H737_ACTM4|nr:rifamycin-inactivating phosphotransferase [Actinoplanes missouriensis]BAL88824.1 putative phosphoenolpyruvate synthase [Actinoplanes missouriensis 431]
MSRYVVNLEELGLDETGRAESGGKAAHLGELSRIGGIRVPPGFCVTTGAFERVVAATPPIRELLGRLAKAGPDDREAIRVLSAGLRLAVESADLPDDLTAEISDRAGDETAWAVRSSATAEDSAAASFAGQHDTYLNVIGPAAVLDAVRRCWASLFAERALTYRLSNRNTDRADDAGLGLRMAVVVQRMVLPRAAGILFTADPVTGNRRITSIDAGFGLGEALVSGLVNADVYRVRDGAVISRTIATKRLAIHAVPSGGTEHREIEPDRRERRVLTDAEIIDLAALGRRIEEHFGAPQDVEWCLDDDGFAIVQSRPITTLFPIPETADDNPHVYVSVGHQQMMTEAMKPLGLSVWKLTSPGHMVDAGGRLFVDVTPRLASPAVGAAMVRMLGRSDPLIGDALQAILDRDGFLPPPPESGPAVTPPPGLREEPIGTDPAVVAELIATREASLAELKRAIRDLTGTALLDFVTADIQGIRQILFDPRNMPAIMAGMEAAWWLNENLETWLGERGAADTLSLSAPDNVTAEMGLALLDVADVIRPYPRVVALLTDAGDDGFLDRLPEVAGGPEAREAILDYLDRYGMRCVGEIDITRPRWSEHPAAIVPLILSNVRNAAPGERARRFEEGRRRAERKEAEVLARLRELPGGAEKAAETKRMIDRLRTFIGYREYPKYHLVSRYFVYKQALLAEARRLVAAGVLADTEDVSYLTLAEFAAVVREQRVDTRLLAERRAAFASFRSLSAPRVLTSEGEAVTATYRRDDLPPGALAGLAVSAGTVEGRARVVLDIADADLEPGDILVTAYTDPSWSPAFVTISGLVTEVGGLMTHGAVIAREYGLPAVVGVENATRLITDGQRIRVHGGDGYLEVL